MLVDVDHESLEHTDVVSLARPSPRAHLRRRRQPHPPRVVVPVRFQPRHLAVVPRAHGQGFAAMRNGLVGGLARIAHEGEVLDADGGKAEFRAGAAVGADAVRGEAGQFLHRGFGGHGVSEGKVTRSTQINKKK